MMKLLPTILPILLVVLKQATSQTLECPNSIDLGKWTKVELNNGAQTFNYAIVLSDSGNPDESIMCGRFESNTDGYIAFGISPEGMYYLTCVCGCVVTYLCVHIIILFDSCVCTHLI